MYHDESHHLGRLHFHPRYGGDEASVDIENVAVFAGELLTRGQIVLDSKPPRNVSAWLNQPLETPRSENPADAEDSGRPSTTRKSSPDFSGHLADIFGQVPAQADIATFPRAGRPRLWRTHG